METVRSKDGTVIAYDKVGQGPPLILVDGALCYRAAGPMRSLAAQLAPHFTVYFYDRRGRELAVSVNVDSVYAIASEIGDKKQAADMLAQALGLKRQTLLAKLKGTRGFLWLKRKIDYAEAAKVKALALRGVYFLSLIHI